MREEGMLSAVRRVGSILSALALSGLGAACYDFHLEGPEDPAPVTTPRLVTVSVEYRQPRGCINESSSTCQEPVVFFGSWMRDGAEFALTPVPGTFVWRGVARNVPVNYPPKDQPYLVRVFDPFLRDSPTGGISGERLRVGNELLVKFDSAGGPEESALVFIDENGFGHNPY
jgi:hypothetical protein